MESERKRKTCSCRGTARHVAGIDAHVRIVCAARSLRTGDVHDDLAVSEQGSGRICQCRMTAPRLTSVSCPSPHTSRSACGEREKRQTTPRSERDSRLCRPVLTERGQGAALANGSAP